VNSFQSPIQGLSRFRPQGLSSIPSSGHFTIPSSRLSSIPPFRPFYNSLFKTFFDSPLQAILRFPLKDFLRFPRQVILQFPLQDFLRFPPSGHFTIPPLRGARGVLPFQPTNPTPPFIPPQGGNFELLHLKGGILSSLASRGNSKLIHLKGECGKIAPPDLHYYPNFPIYRYPIPQLHSTSKLKPPSNFDIIL